MSAKDPPEITQHLDALGRYARALTRDATAADDLVQDTLVRALERAGAYRAGDLRPSQLFTWRRELRYAAEVAQAAVPEPMFVPAVISPEPVAVAAPVPRKKRVRRAHAAAVELVIDGVAVKIARGADTGVIAAVIDALKAR